MKFVPQRPWGRDVHWWWAVTHADGRREPVDAIVPATGYRPDFGHLEGSGAPDADGCPLHREGRSCTHTGSGYVGLEWQGTPASATLRGVGRDARFVVSTLSG